MKKFLITSIAFFLFTSLHAQDRSIKMDGGLGAALTFGDFKAYGISASVEPKFFFNKQISAGLRFEGDVLFGGSISSSAGNVDVNLSSRAATLVKGEYYFSEAGTRPFVGLMFGRYVQASSGVSVDGTEIPDSSLSAVRSFGFAPEVGVTFNNFRISGIYHIVSEGDEVSVTTGSGADVDRNYFVIQLGFKIFQIDI